MPSQANRKIIETIAATAACCEVVKRHSGIPEAKRKAEETHNLLNTMLLRYNTNYFKDVIPQYVLDKIVYICDNILFRNQTGYHASIINLAILLLEDRFIELSARSKDKNKIVLFESAIKAMTEIYQIVVPEDDPNFETAESIGKEAYEAWKQLS